MFTNDSQVMTSTAEQQYYNSNNSSYAITNLDSNVQNYTDPNGGIMEFTDEFNQTQHDRNTNILNNGNGQSVMTPYAEAFIVNHNSINDPINSDAYLNHDDYFYGSNKFGQTRTLENSADYVFVSSEEIIDNVILDLTNDEVEQILDDNLISTHDFDSISGSNSLHQCNRTPKINIATNLTKTFSPIIHENDGKLSEFRSLETPTINLDAAVLDIESISSEASTTPNLQTIPATKKKSGRTKGARQISK